MWNTDLFENTGYSFRRELPIFPRKSVLPQPSLMIGPQLAMEGNSLWRLFNKGWYLCSGLLLPEAAEERCSPVFYRHVSFCSIWSCECVSEIFKESLFQAHNLCFYLIKLQREAKRWRMRLKIFTGWLHLVSGAKSRLAFKPVSDVSEERKNLRVGTKVWIWTLHPQILHQTLTSVAFQLTP